MLELATLILERGDMAHFALFLWACVSSSTVLILIRELSLTNTRLDVFVRELARFNRSYQKGD
jgi:hypothetical protein